MKKIFLYISFVFSLGLLLNLFSITNVSAQQGICSSPGTCIVGTSCTRGYIPYPGNCSIFGPNYTCCQPENKSTNRLLLDKIFCVSSNSKDGTTTDPDSGYIYTAIGCIPVTNMPDFITWILGWAIGIGGGISLMLIIVASFQIISSSGNPEKVQAGKELLTSAIAGLIMLIFSVFILKVIGVDILKLPGLK